MATALDFGEVAVEQETKETNETKRTKRKKRLDGGGCFSISREEGATPS